MLDHRAEGAVRVLQPEQKGAIQVNMIVMAALVEGAAIIALLVVCYALVNKA